MSSLFVQLMGFICLFFSSNANANLLTVNNAGNGSAQYTSISSAILAASAGDTLYISPSSSNYGSFTIDKSLVIAGKGNAADVQQPLQTAVTNIIINAHISGISILGIKTENINLGLGNNLIAFSRCYINGALTLNDSITNLAISNCIFAKVDDSNIISGGCAAIGYVGLSTILIQNNVFNGYIWELSGSSVIQNNIFISNGNAFMSQRHFGGCNTSQLTQYAIIQNNIFYRANPYEWTSACIFNNNISYKPSSAFGVIGGTNLDNTDPQFVNFIAGGDYFSYNYNFHLKAVSPGKNAGTDGKDIGLYGGNYDASLTGEPIGIPVIRKMNVQNFNAPQNGNVNVHVRSTKAR